MKNQTHFRTFASLLFALLLLNSCRKEETILSQFNDESYDTVKPKQYFPIYPGSWWNYRNASGDTVQKTAGPYVLHSFTTSSNMVTPLKWVPYWEGKYYYGYAYPVTFATQFHSGSVYTIEMADLLRENAPGAEWETYSYVAIPPYGPYTKYKCKIMHADTTMLVQNQSYANCIHTRETHESYHPSLPGITRTYSDFYYAPGIGIIRTDSIDTVSFVAYPKLELLNYYINN